MLRRVGGSLGPADGPWASPVRNLRGSDRLSLGPADGQSASPVRNLHGSDRLMLGGSPGPEDGELAPLPTVTLTWYCEKTGRYGLPPK